MDRVLVLLAVLAVTAAFSAWWRARDGRVIARGSVTAGAPSRWDALPVEAADVVAAVTASTPLVLVEFTAPDCQPCAATKVLLDGLTADREDVSVVTIDVADALDLARAHRIMRAPTTLLVTERGHLLGRVSGLPREAELVALLDQARDPDDLLASRAA